MWQGWRLFGLLSAALCIAAGIVSWLTVPDFASISGFRIDKGNAPVINVALAGPPHEDLLLYLPSHGGRVDVSLGGDDPVNRRIVGTVSEVSGSQLTRDRQFGTLTIPAELGLTGDGPLRLAQRDNYQSIGMTPAYLGPQSAIEPVVEQHRRIGRAMQLVLPITAVVTILVSTLLIFFSRKPLKYLLLIGAFACQLVVELADELTPSLPAMEYVMPFMSVAANCMIIMAIAVWTAAPAHHRRYVLWSSLAMALVLLTVLLTGTTNAPLQYSASAALFGAWIVSVQLLAWVMIIRSKRLDEFTRVAGLATFLLCNFGLVSYHLLSVVRPDIELAFFLSNWVNVATAGGVLIFVGGALVTEMMAYRRQVRTLSVLEQIVSGHGIELDEQAEALRLEIERSAVLEERQRFLRDMHDGLGGQLLTLLLRLRRTDGATAKLADDVQAMIGDLRLMTSALDEDGVSLIAALAKLRERIARQCLSGEIELAWGIDLPPEFDLPTGSILHVLRIIEEAATNAVRHASCRNLAISIRVAQRLEIIVSDDGSGFNREAIVSGTGLRSIEQRTARLGGTLVSGCCGTTCGTHLHITAPLPALSRNGPATPVAALHAPLRFSI